MSSNHLLQMIEAYKSAGGDAGILDDPTKSYLFVHKHEVCKMRSLPGLTYDYNRSAEGIEAKLRVTSEFRGDSPIQLCFGMIPKSGIQRIKLKAFVEDNAKARFIAYCIFPNSLQVVHQMDAEIVVGDNALFDYREQHYHGDTNGADVNAVTKASCGKNSKIISEFNLNKGRVGKLYFEISAKCGEGSTGELTAKIASLYDDSIVVNDSIDLSAPNSKGIIKTRIVVRDKSHSEVRGKVIAREAGCIGHIDCMETLLGNSTAIASPMIEVLHPMAKVTHEAAIGRVNDKQIETLMARGLTAEEAIDLIVKGLLA